MKKLLLLAMVALFFGLQDTTVMAAASDTQGDAQDEALKKERQIFLWDVTISMVGATQNASCPKASKRRSPYYAYDQGFPNYNADKDIFDKTREQLIGLINDIDAESTEIIVLPFRDGIVGEFRAYATEAGKEQLKEQILNWDDLQAGGTFTATCLKNAVNKYFTKDRINRIFLLTDGEPSNNEGQKLLDYLRNWKGVKEVHGKSSYLVYIMLTEEAIIDEVDDIAKNSGGDILVTTDFENPVYLSLTKSTDIHVRDFFDGKIATDGDGKIEILFEYVKGKSIPENSVFHCIVDKNDYLNIDSTIPITPSDGVFTIPFQLTKPLEAYLKELPHNYNYTLKARLVKDANANKSIDITGGSVIEIALVIKPEPRVKIRWSTK